MGDVFGRANVSAIGPKLPTQFALLLGPRRLFLGKGTVGAVQLHGQCILHARKSLAEDIPRYGVCLGSYELKVSQLLYQL